MSYHGYIPHIKNFLNSLPKQHVPTVLEVGVDRGVTLVTLTAFLARTRSSFLAIGVDVKVQEQVTIMLANLDLTPQQHAYCIEQNSLTLLPMMVDQGMKFDVMLIDGDHNYHTVSNELKYVNQLTHDHSVVLIDDYDGRWAEKDLFYSERDGYEDNQHTTKKVDTEKHGVKVAVDEWLSANQIWKSSKLLQGEPIVLQRLVTK